MAEFPRKPRSCQCCSSDLNGDHCVIVDHRPLEKCVHATELVRPEAANFDQSAARDEQKYAFISGLSPRYRSGTTKNLSSFVRIIINKITQSADLG